MLQSRRAQPLSPDRTPFFGPGGPAFPRARPGYSPVSHQVCASVRFEIQPEETGPRESPGIAACPVGLRFGPVRGDLNCLYSNQAHRVVGAAAANPFPASSRPASCFEACPHVLEEARSGGMARRAAWTQREGGDQKAPTYVIPVAPPAPNSNRSTAENARYTKESSIRRCSQDRAKAAANRRTEVLKPLRDRLRRSIRVSPVRAARTRECAPRHPSVLGHGSLPYANAVLVWDVLSTQSVRPCCSTLKVS